MHIYTILRKRLTSFKNGSKFFLLACIFLLSAAQGFAQVPPNDELCGAIDLPVSAVCTPQQFSNIDASASPNTPLPTCENFTDADVWFKFTVPAGATQITLNSGAVGVFSDAGAAVYSFTGTVCTAYTLTQLTCATTGGTLGTGDFPLATVPVTAGNTYYIRFYGFGGETGNFKICVTANIPPTNDNCASTTALTVNPDYLCAATTNGTTINATQSPQGGTPTCGNAAGFNDDVWYTFVATGPQHRIVLSNIVGTSTNLTTVVYSGTCAALTQVFCGTTNSMDISGLTANTTYYVRIYTNQATAVTSTFTICVGTAPPPPSNDNCINATTVPVNADLNCTLTATGGTESATPSTGVPAPSCGNATGVNDDVWYKFTATGPTHWISLSNIVPAANVLTFTVYSGTCAGGFTEIGCSTTSPLVVSGLTANTVYYVRVYTNVATVGVSATFNLCVATPPPAPANDNCVTATPLTVNPDLNCGVVTAGTTTSATPSTGAPTPSCGTATGVNDDVWYSFTATGASHWVSLANISGGNALTFTVYSGTCAGGLTEIGCSTTNLIAFNNLTPNSVYYVRVYTNVATPTISSTFNICVGTPVPPANDNCPNAVPLTVNANYNCGVTTPGTTSGATPSAGAPAPTCGNATGVNDDVWFSFTATGPGHRVSLGNILPAGTAMTFTVYSGTCGALTQIGCATTGTLDLTGLTANAVYYVRVYTNVNVLSTIATFTVCVGTPPPPPTNDECVNAIPLPVNSDANCGLFTGGYTIGATQSTTLPAPTCGTLNGWNDDVWYTFVATNVNQQVSLSNVVGTVTNMTTVVYSGTNCTNLALFQCKNGPLNNLYGLTVGQTYFIRVYTDATGINNTASFNICVGTIPPPSAGTLCAVSQPFCTSSQPSQNSPTIDPPGSPGMGQYGCLFTTPNPNWYVLQVATAGTLVINIHQENAAGVGLDVDYAAWGPFTSVASGCAQIVPTASTGPPMVSCSYSAAANETVTIPNVVPGQIYILLVTNYNGGAGTITFTPGGTSTATTDCGIVCNATATNSGPVCPGGTFNLNGSTTISGATYSWTGPGGYTSNVQNPTNVVAPATTGSYNYIFTVTVGANTCTATTTVIVSSNTAITLTSAASTANQSVCTNTAITNITYAVTGATGASVTGLPAGVTGTYAAGVYTISGTPTINGTYPYTVTTTGGCNAGSATQSGTITVTTGATLALSSAAGTSAQTVCVNTAITPITYAAGNGATGATVTGLPAGVTGTFAGGTFTINGTPTASGTFNYTVATSGGCGSATQTGTLTVTNATVTLTSAPATANQTVCVNTAITPITYGIGGGGTGAIVTGLPAGVTGTFAGGVLTISGTPSINGSFPYTVNATGCGTASQAGTITVSTQSTVTLSSAGSTNAQTVCANTAITPITYTIGGGGTGATVTGLPAGVTGTYAGGVFTISGAPTSAAGSPFTYTVSATGGCGTATQTGTITVSPASTLALSSAAGTTNQTVCVNTAITPITYNGANGTTGATVTGLPAGVTGTYAGGVFTISGTPTASGSFPYTVSSTGGCGTVTQSGTITVSTPSTITLSSAAGTNAQTVCVNTAITPITYATGGGATGATVTALPAGVTGVFAGGTMTISGTPTTAGIYSYTVTTTGGCGTATLNGAITVGTASTVTLSSAAGTNNQTVCINAPITGITYTIAGGAGGATVTGLPAGVTGTYAGNTMTINGTPTAAGTFTYTVNATGGCGTPSQTGTITVNAASTVTLSSGAGTGTQTVCVNTTITTITYATGTGVTGATVTGLPAGVTGTYAGGVLTISGTPTAIGSFPYTVSTTGGCGTATQAGSITINTVSTFTLSSAAATTNQTICANSGVTNITYAGGGGITGATVTGLPAGVTGTYAGGVFTISGTATAAGTFNYTVTTTGGCGTITRTGTITVSPALFANAGPNVTIASGQSTQLNGTGTAGANYLWTASGPLSLSSATILNPIANPLQTTTYTLTVSDPSSPCPSASSNVTVTVVTSCINVRNAFTPNGDGINERWFVYDQAFCLADGGVTVNVYNRYGNKVYENRNYTNNWDGTYKGKPVPDGTYYAVVEFRLANGKKQTVRTDLTVLR